MSRRIRGSKKQQQSEQQTGITQLQIGIVAGIAVIMVLAFIVMNRGGGDEAPVETAAAADPAPAAENETSTDGGAAAENTTNDEPAADQLPMGLTEEGDPFLGAPDAPVTIIEYSDYQCPHCGAFAKATLPKVIDTYITTGQVRHVHRNAAILGEESQWSAMAALCASEQDKFWNYHDILFQRQGGRNEGAFSRDNLKQFAEDLGLDTAGFNACLDENRYSEKVVAETLEAKERGVEGTPSFFVNDELVPGNVPFEDLQTVIEKHLESSS